jgi:hypothetical protein
VDGGTTVLRSERIVSCLLATNLSGEVFPAAEAELITIPGVLAAPGLEEAVPFPNVAEPYREEPEPFR